jgi:hypothetical protein
VIVDIEQRTAAAIVLLSLTTFQPLQNLETLLPLLLPGLPFKPTILPKSVEFDLPEKNYDVNLIEFLAEE